MSKLKGAVYMDTLGAIPAVQCTRKSGSMLNGFVVPDMTGDDAIAVRGRFAPVAAASKEDMFLLILEVRGACCALLWD